MSELASDEINPTLTARDLIAKWGPGGPAFALNERAGAQAHFIDLCRMLGMPEPDNPARYCFERGLTQTGSSGPRVNGFADVWLQGHFAWEYKAPGKSLEGALKQLMMYALPLESPPLLVVSDRLRIEIHTHFTGTPSERHVIALDDLGHPEVQEKLRWLWRSPKRFQPSRSNREITEEAARTFAGTADRLRAAGVKGEEVSHFLTQCLFCFFAEDVGLLPARLFERLVGVKVDPGRMRTQLQALFVTMRDGGLFGAEDVPWFNGGLFKVVKVPTLCVDDVNALKAASALNWSAIDPSIFGTLFERGLDPSKRSQLGAHYTDPATILRLVHPVVQRPLMARWALDKNFIQERLKRSDELRAEAARIPSTSAELKKKFAQVRGRANEAERAAQKRFAEFLEHMRSYRVLDPACGSGNFLYLSLKCLKDIEHRVNLEAELLGLARQYDVTGPHNVLGIEINEYAAELARLTVWIGELQWRIQCGYGFKLNPVLEPLDSIECRDALLDQSGAESSWPEASVVIGNPPFVGDKKMLGELGSPYTKLLRSVYKGRVPGGADFVCYWFEKARALLEQGKVTRAGFVSTNSIRGGRNRAVLDEVVRTAHIVEAWSDEPWINDGAAVRVSLVSFAGEPEQARLDGHEVGGIAADLTPFGAGGGTDLTEVRARPENANTSYVGIQKTGPFEVNGALAREWLRLPNPNGRPNSDVVKPWSNGLDVTRRNRDMWIVDFGSDMERDQACLYEAPFAYVDKHVRPTRVGKREARTNEYWWLFQWSRPTLRRAVARLSRCIVTLEVSKHRVFAWLPTSVVADKNLSVVAREDDVTFGVLHSRLHELWTLRMCTWMGKGNDPRYTPTTCFETFPFPAGMSPACTAGQDTMSIAPASATGGDAPRIPSGLAPEAKALAEPIARAAHALTVLRDGWLNPSAWADRVPEVIPLGLAASPFPDRWTPRPGFEAELAQRTLTKLYNLSPAWLVDAHEQLDAAVAAAYGWQDYSPTMRDDEILGRLLTLNQAPPGA